MVNYRKFENFEFDLNPSLTVLVGDNGVGKTTVLDAVAVAVGPFLSKFDNVSGSAITPQDARVRLSALGTTIDR